MGSRKSGLAIELDAANGEPLFGTLAYGGNLGDQPMAMKKKAPTDGTNGFTSTLARSGSPLMPETRSHSTSPTKARQRNSSLTGSQAPPPGGPNFSQSPQAHPGSYPALQSTSQQLPLASSAMQHSRSRSPSTMINEAFPPPLALASAIHSSSPSLSSRPMGHQRMSSNFQKELPPLPSASPTPDSSTASPNGVGSPNSASFGDRPSSASSYPQPPSVAAGVHAHQLSANARPQSQHVSSMSSRRQGANTISPGPFSQASWPMSNHPSEDHSELSERRGFTSPEPPRQQQQQRSSSAMYARPPGGAGNFATNSTHHTGTWSDYEPRKEKKRGKLSTFFGGKREVGSKAIQEPRPTREELGL